MSIKAGLLKDPVEKAANLGSKFQNSLEDIFLPGHVRALVQREAKHSKGRERGIWQTVSREVMEPGIRGSLRLRCQLNFSIRPDQTRPYMYLFETSHMCPEESIEGESGQGWEAGKRHWASQADSSCVIFVLYETKNSTCWLRQ